MPIPEFRDELKQPDELIRFVKSITGRILSKRQAVVKLCQATANEGLQTGINRGMTIESDVSGLCFATADQKEGITAFFKSGKPDLLVNNDFLPFQ